MTRFNWLLACAALGAILLAGCNNAPAPASGTNPEPTKTDTTSTEPEKKTDEAAGAATTPETKKDSTVAAKPDEKATEVKPEAKTDAAKPDAKDPKAADQAKSSDSAKANEEKVNVPQSVTAQAVPKGDEKATVRTKPIPQKDPTPADVDKSASTAKFAGTWKRFIEPKLRAKYEKVAQIQRKRGKKIFPIDNILTMKADGTFVWDDNALITGRKVTGTWSVKGGIATFIVKTVDGAPPTKTEAKTFEASIAKSGKMLYRGNTARGRYDKS